jgi:hypothetical protein
MPGHTRFRSSVIGVMAAVMAYGTVATTAQETSTDTSRPASIHTGTCDAPGDVVAELQDLVVMFDDDTDDDGGTDPSTPSDDDDTDDDDDDNGRRLPGSSAFQPSSGGDFVGAEDASVVEGSEDSDIGIGLDALLADPHVIAVFESDNSETIIACGSIGGFFSGDDDTLAVGLREQNNSGFAGVALLDDDDDDNELDVDLYIARDVAGGS